MEPPTYLAEKFPHERDSHIQFDEGPHIYTIDGDSDFMSVTRWNHSHFPHFNAGKIIKNMMKSKNWKNSKYFGKQGGYVKSLNTVTDDLFDQMRAAFNAISNSGILGTVKLHVVDGTPALESGAPSTATQKTLNQHKVDSVTEPGATIDDEGYTNNFSLPNIIGFCDYFETNQGYNYNELHNATFLITIT